MEHYVTIFDSVFLPQGLALHESLERHAANYQLWVLCMDEVAFDVLERLQLPNVRPMRLADVETAELKGVKATRTRVEYCWTLSPFAPRFVFDADRAVDRVTYLDADIAILRDPAEIHRELDRSGKHVLITEHAYAPEHDRTATSGRFCVQFVTFTRGAEPVRRWWQDRCIEWCHARFEDGKFGDQMYLDDWPERFRDAVHVLQHREWALAPWNAARFSHENAVFYHFHGVRLLSSTTVDVGPYLLPRALVRAVYRPYLSALARAVAGLAAAGFDVRQQSPHRGRRWAMQIAGYRLLRHGLRFGARRVRRL